jgi:acetyltransferase-like isoleucine patch superfamily enzyme
VAVASFESGQWKDGQLPANVRVGSNTRIHGELAFKRFRSRHDPALTIGGNCTLDGVQFALGPDARMTIADYCYFTNVILMCEQEMRIGSYVMMGWNSAIADSDFHPLEPALRIADAMACSPLGEGRPRPELVCRPVVIEDGVWIGPNATILKGVHIGAGAFIEPGTLLTSDVPAGARVLGNPARVIAKRGEW